jgi:bifunctional non-homologous end joining protein LigD
MAVRHPSGFIAPCLPSKVVRPPSGSLWLHEIKFDGYRLMVRRDARPRVRCFTRNGYHWAHRSPAIVAAANRIKASTFLIDGEVVIVRNDGTSDFRALRSRRRGHEAVLYAFDLIEQDGDDLRDLPLIERKQRLKKLIGKARHAILFTEHLHAHAQQRRPSRGRQRAARAFKGRDNARPLLARSARNAGGRRRQGRCRVQGSSEAGLGNPEQT